jgi:agmatinase
MDHVSTLTQVGIRSIRNTEEMHRDSIADGNQIVSMDEWRDLGPAGVAETIQEGARCYVSLDIDVLDLSLVPGCVSAEPDGVSYAGLRDTLTAVAGRADVVGFDVVEVNPQLDVGTGITSYLAAHLAIEFLGRICDQPRWVARRDERAERRTAAGRTDGGRDTSGG